MEKKIKHVEAISSFFKFIVGCQEDWIIEFTECCISYES